jgi:20S proteasome alpha/beta subunit
MLSANLRLLELNTERRARVISAIRLAKQHLFKYMGYVGAYLLVGGVDATGPHLYDVSANGTSMSKPYAASGSGSYAAVTVLERDYKFAIDVSRCVCGSVCRCINESVSSYFLFVDAQRRGWLSL